MTFSNIYKKNLSVLKNNLPKTFYESGTIFKIGTSKIAYLFELNNIYYGVDLLMYKINKKIIPIYNIEKREILDFLSSKQYINIVEFLYLNKVQPFKEISKLYYNLRKIVFS